MASLKEIGDKISEFVDKVKSSLEDEAMRQLIAEDLGLPPSAPVPKPTLPQDKLDSIAAYRSKADPDKEAFILLLSDVKAVYEAVRSFIASLGVSSITTQNQVLYKLFDLFALNEVRTRAPGLFAFMQVLSTIVEDSAELPQLTTDDLAEERFFKMLALTLEFALSPLYYITQVISAKDTAEAKRTSDRLFPQIAGLVAYLQEKPLDDSRLEYGWDSFVVPKKDKPLEFTRPPGAGTPNADGLAERMLTIGFPFAQSPTDTSSIRENLDLTFAIVPASDGPVIDATTNPIKRDSGLLIGVGGEGGLELQAGERWKFSLEASAKPAFSLFLSTIKPPFFTKAFGPNDLPLNVTLATIPNEQNVTYQFPHESATHVEIGQVAFTFSYDGFKGEIKGEVRRGAIVLATKDQDGFISNFLPKDGLRVPFNFGAGLSTDKGFFTAGDIPFISDKQTKPKPASTPAAAAAPRGFAAFAGVADTIEAMAAPVALPPGVAVPGATTPATAAPITMAAGTISAPIREITKRGVTIEADAPTTRVSDPPPVVPPPPTPPLSSTPPLAAADAAPGPSGNGNGSVPTLSTKTKPEPGLETIIPIGKGILGVRVNQLLLALRPGTKPGTAAKAEASVQLTLTVGPIEAVVDRIGFEVALSFPESGGNAGFADFSAGFKAPTGVGIKVQHPAVTGGGFLFLDSEKGQYAGVLQLALEGGISVKAVGIIATRLPDGRKGYSFLILITVEDFKPIPLGLGFTLTGIGGLVAINRTVDADALREGIKNKTLNDILFPKDPIRNAPQIIGSLNRVFPIREGSHLFGPVVQICWFTPPLITMDLGVIIEIGNRTRLVVLGRVTAILPNEKLDLIRLQMNVVGIIDFDQKSISLDAVLYDSRLVGKFPITGSMALRVNWGAQKEFALSVGGFHPAFKPPPNFPVLERLAISFADSDSFRLRVEGYFAITANTVQWGARAELFAKAAGFSITGSIGYDVLIQFSPFGFIADFHASVQLKRGSHNLFKIAVEGELRGPRPLHLKGKATFEIFWCDFTIHVDHTFLSGEAPPKLPPVRVMDQLKAALDDPRNWTGQLGDVERAMVTLRQSQTPTQLALHPLGKLGVKQAIVPLELQIAKFGASTPADARLFSIKTVTMNGNDVTARTTKEKDFFAPAQFLDLSDDEKLAAPSFEPMIAGVTVGADSIIFTTDMNEIIEDGSITFETIILDKTNDTKTTDPIPFTVPVEKLGRQIAIGAAARSEVRRAGVARYQPPAGKNSQIAKNWTVVSTFDQQSRAAIPGVDPAKPGSYAESFQALEKLKKDDPARAKLLMLVRV